MYKISEFSRITGLTTKALRYYDDEGLLIPTRKEENNYRVYNEKDYEKAKLIIMLKDLDFSLLEIKDVLQNFEDEADITTYLLEKERLILAQIKKQKETLSKLKIKITAVTMEEKKMNYTFEIKEIAPTRVISIRTKANWQDTGQYIGKLYSAAKEKTNGAMTTIYYDGEYKELADMEICVPVSGIVNKAAIENKTLPAIKALCTTHIGKYENLKLAYKALYDYAEKNNIKLTTPHREIYLKGPGMILQGNPNKYITEIIFPIHS